MSKQIPLLLLLMVLVAFASHAAAQDNKRESQLRTVRGLVLDKSDAPISAGVVFLKNNRTNAVRSYILSLIHI